MSVSGSVVLLLCFSLSCLAQITFRLDSGSVYLRHDGKDIINLSTASKVEVEVGEWFQYFGNFIIVRRATGAYKNIINRLDSLALSFDGTTVDIKTRTIQRTDGPGVMYFIEGEIGGDPGNAFYTTDATLITRIEDALDGSPGDLPTPPPYEGDWSSWNPWSSCSVSCGSGFRTRTRMCQGCVQSCCICPTGEQFQVEECHKLSCDGEWGEWNSFSSCSHNCGGGFRTRTRECEGPGECFPGKSFQYQDCNNQNCCHT